MKKTLTATALALSLGSTPAHAAFQLGWNKIYIFNCLTLTRINSPATGAVSAAANGAVAVASSTAGANTVLWVFPDTTKTAGLTSNDTFTTTDLYLIVQLEPFCRSGLPLYVQFFNVNPAQWDAISVYPELK
jgi:hypothetical protein